MTITKKAVSADIHIPLKGTICSLSRLSINGIQVATFQPYDVATDLPGILDKMETLAGYRHAGFWVEANAVRYPEKDPVAEQQTWIYHFYDSDPF